MKWILFLLLPLCSGCSLFGDFRKQSFDTGKYGVVRLQVPKGFKKKELLTDSAGNRQLQYSYLFGGRLFFTTDTTLSEYIDTAQHIVKPHFRGGRFYKGLLPKNAFWREVYSQGLKYGYQNIGPEAEPLFDSSLNYIRVEKK